MAAPPPVSSIHYTQPVYARHQHSLSLSCPSTASSGDSTFTASRPSSSSRPSDVDFLSTKAPSTINDRVFDETVDTLSDLPTPRMALKPREARAHGHDDALRDLRAFFKDTSPSQPAPLSSFEPAPNPSPRKLKKKWDPRNRLSLRPSRDSPRPHNSHPPSTTLSQKVSSDGKRYMQIVPKPFEQPPTLYEEPSDTIHPSLHSGLSQPSLQEFSSPTSSYSPSGIFSQHQSRPSTHSTTSYTGPTEPSFEHLRPHSSHTQPHQTSFSLFRSKFGQQKPQDTTSHTLFEDGQSNLRHDSTSHAQHSKLSVAQSSDLYPSFKRDADHEGATHYLEPSAADWRGADDPALRRPHTASSAHMSSLRSLSSPTTTTTLNSGNAVYRSPGSPLRSSFGKIGDLISVVGPAPSKPPPKLPANIRLSREVSGLNTDQLSSFITEHRERLRSLGDDAPALKAENEKFQATLQEWRRIRARTSGVGMMSVSALNELHAQLSRPDTASKAATTLADHSPAPPSSVPSSPSASAKITATSPPSKSAPEAHSLVEAKEQLQRKVIPRSNYSHEHLWVPKKLRAAPTVQRPDTAPAKPQREVQHQQIPADPASTCRSLASDSPHQQRPLVTPPQTSQDRAIRWASRTQPRLPSSSPIQDTASLERPSVLEEARNKSQRLAPPRPVEALRSHPINPEPGTAHPINPEPGTAPRGSHGARYAGRRRSELEALLAERDRGLELMGAALDAMLTTKAHQSSHVRHDYNNNYGHIHAGPSKNAAKIYGRPALEAWSATDDGDHASVFEESDLEGDGEELEMLERGGDEIVPGT